MFNNRKVTAILLSLVMIFITATAVLVGSMTGSIGSTAGNESSITPGNTSSDISSEDSSVSSDVSDDVSGDTSEDSSGDSSDIDLILPPVTNDGTPAQLNLPNEMHAVFLTPGEDFAKDSGDSEARLRADIDTAIRTAKELSMNTVIINTRAIDDTVVYHSSYLPTYHEELDLLDYAIKKAREYDMYILAVLSASQVTDGGSIERPNDASPKTLSSVYNHFYEFTQNYAVDGVLIDDYYTEVNEESYQNYLKYGSQMGFDEYILYVAEANVRQAAKAVKAGNKDLLLGLYTEDVWMNASEEYDGPNTTASFQAMIDGNADTKAFAESGLFDAVFVEAEGSLTAYSIPFGPIVTWWDELLEAQDMMLYVVHASSKACTSATGWSSPDQLARQVNAAQQCATYKGSCFDSLSDLERDPQGSTTALIKFFNNETSAEHILKELALSKPGKKELTTSEPLIQFAGASDPNFEVTFNGNKLSVDQNGFFSMEIELRAGTNEFVFEHKGKTLKYSIYREVDVLKEVSPATGVVTVDGEDKVTVSAMAYTGSKVTATLAGQTITLVMDDTETDDTNKDSDYQLYVGTFTAPAATSTEQDLGKITVQASWETESEAMNGATVIVNKRPVQGTGRVIQVTASAAETFPTGVLNDYSDPDYFPLPKGTVDRVLGDELSFTDEEGVTHKYYKLESGVRVYSKDITFIGDQTFTNNTISGMTVTADQKTTKVILSMGWKVPFITTYSSSSISFRFDYTTSVPNSLSLNKNPLFSAANWSGSTLTLRFLKNDAFMGFKSYYDGNNLVLEFTNPALIQSASNGYGYTLTGTKIAIDSGHGGPSNPGAVGVHPSYPEAKINQAITAYLKQELQSIGATVYLIDCVTVDPSLESRVNQAKNFGAHMMISVHQNSALSSSATGTEAFYFNDYSMNLAKQVSSRVSSALGLTNRGAKFGRYYVTRDSQFPSILLECGFISNPSEHFLLMQSENQLSIAKAAVNGIIAHLRSTGAASSHVTGTQSTGSGAVLPPSSSEDPSSSEPPSPSETPSEEDQAATLLTPETVNLTLSNGKATHEVKVDLGSGTLKATEYMLVGCTVTPQVTDGVATWSLEFTETGNYYYILVTTGGTEMVKEIFITVS